MQTFNSENSILFTYSTYFLYQNNLVLSLTTMTHLQKSKQQLSSQMTELIEKLFYHHSTWVLLTSYYTYLLEVYCWNFVLKYRKRIKISSWPVSHNGLNQNCLFSDITPARTHSISALKSRVLKLTFLALKMIVISGLEFILKFT